MRTITIGVGSISARVGDLTGNRALLEQLISEATDQGVTLLCTPELGISGYSLEDRVLWNDFADRCFDQVLQLADRCQGIDVFVGTPVRLGDELYNGLVFLSGGRPWGISLKQALPNHGVFYEHRQWTAWTAGHTTIHGLPAGEVVYRQPYGVVGAEICEDMWIQTPPAVRLAAAGAEIIVNGSASPFWPGKQAIRCRLAEKAAQSLNVVYAMANLLGCDSSRLVFDGGGLVAEPDGRITEGPRLSCEPYTLWTHAVDLDRQRPAEPRIPTREADPPRQVFYLPGGAEQETAHLDEILDAMALGVRDYFVRAGAFEKMLVALSGGRDSALTLIAAWRAAKALPEDNDPTHRIACRYLPTNEFSSPETREAALGLARELSIPAEVVSIQEAYDQAKVALSRMTGDADRIPTIALENAQARIRAALMLGWANCVHGLVLVTSNMSEFAVGYFTTGGDNQGGFAPIVGLPKTLVSRLLERAAQRWHLTSLEQIFALPPSAELKEAQSDEAELMPYPILDDILYLFAADRLPPVQVWQRLRERHPDRDAGQLKEWVRKFVRLFAANQWKRDQSPAGLKLLELDLDPQSGFRFPVLQSIEDDLRLLEEAAAG